MRAASATDFSQFAQLRAEARANSPEAVKGAAKQFEALMLQNMLKTMRSASLGDDVMGGEQSKFYQQMFDAQIAQHMAAGRGLGVADMLVRQLQSMKQQPEASSVDATAGSKAFPISPRDRAAFSLAAPAPSGLPVQSPSAHGPAYAIKSPIVMEGGSAPAPALAAVGQGDAPTTSTIVNPGVRKSTPVSAPAADAAAAGAGQAAKPAYGSPEAFVKQVLPHAQRAAAELGIPAKVLVAQAALETGWGRHAIRQADGRPALNFFGIKADKRWQGERTHSMTHEYHNGQMHQESATFRSYDSIGAAFDDFVSFVKSNPRYAGALQHGGDAGRFVSGLQKAGYATDPAYAHKIMRIAEGRTMQLALAQIQPARTLTV